MGQPIKVSRKQIAPILARSRKVALGFIVVEHSIFCGRDTGIRVYVNPRDLGRILPEPETVALIADRTERPRVPA